MLQSKLFTKIQKTPPKDEESLNAKFLEQAGFIQKTSSGVYVFLPLGLRVLVKIENIVREEMNKAGGVEVLMPGLQPKENWETTGRWKGFDALFKTESGFGGEYALGPTHEEIIYPLLLKHISSYRDLPISVYQIQTKFRDEKRAKSGLLRGREFRMKDLYSFHSNDEDRDAYYEVMKKSYIEIFKRLGINAIPTTASGGTFSELSMEFQVICKSGEDVIHYCEKCNIAQNKEIAEISSPKCPNCGGETREEKAIEVGNIFPLKDKYAKDFNLMFKDKNGDEQLVSAGCYGLGTTRVMGTIAEIKNDERGLIWPKNIAPFAVHLISLSGSENIQKEADKIYDLLIAKGIEVLYDNRADKSAGEKFAEADLIGIPMRIVISDKTIKEDSLEKKMRHQKETRLIKISDILKEFE
jgi:prolyl-tRNA synthetase